MAGVVATLSLQVAAKLIGSADLGNPIAPVTLEKVVRIAAGTDALGKADVLWADTRTIAASSTENLDLAGALAGLLGGTVTAAEITAIVVVADAGNTNDVVLFGAASNAFNGPLSGTTPKHALGPDDVYLATNKKGWTVTPATGDILLVANSGSGTAVTYSIILFGRTVAA
ncbi:hypothetical protein [Sphingomonas bisphenolicum]|uniref:Uncharacterized protein n=1 Tax=Sphingomonas bisphenolicum TaxID=296544 RepID=A0ABM7G6A3_9SPHN|nr:hypothetical protein [Sphingomonas bisphenolicum]BBF70203.1 hypothetical protein SBA_ch1_24030 [Sphingomonas bisphenolicum]